MRAARCSPSAACSTLARRRGARSGRSREVRVDGVGRAGRLVSAQRGVAASVPERRCRPCAGSPRAGRGWGGCSAPTRGARSGWCRKPSAVSTHGSRARLAGSPRLAKNASRAARSAASAGLTNAERRAPVRIVDAVVLRREDLRAARHAPHRQRLGQRPSGPAPRAARRAPPPPCSRCAPAGPARPATTRGRG